MVATTTTTVEMVEMVAKVELLLVEILGLKTVSRHKFKLKINIILLPETLVNS